MPVPSSQPPIPLFGGAIFCLIPPRFIDTSQFRDVADSQEVYSDGNVDHSIIVDIVEHQGEVSDADCAKYFFEDLAEVQDCPAELTNIEYEDAQVFVRPVGRDGTVASTKTIIGTQMLGKYREEQRNKVRIFMHIVRLPRHGSDILITLNAPVETHPQSSSASMPIVDASEDFRKLVDSFVIADFGLFG